MNNQPYVLIKCKECPVLYSDVKEAMAAAVRYRKTYGYVELWNVLTAELLYEWSY